MFKFVVLVAFVGFAAAASLGSLDSDVHAEVKALDNDILPDGSFHYGYQLSNGVDITSAGNANAIQGSYKFVTPDGQTVELSYVADADGFHPSGALLPTPPPIPEAIARAVQYNLAHPQATEQLLARKLL